MRWESLFWTVAPVAVGLACGALASGLVPVATPLAVDAGKKLVESVMEYVESKGKEPTQVNCEEEWHPKEKELLILCTAKYK